MLGNDYRQEFQQRAIAPFYLVEAPGDCWRCGAVDMVIAFAAAGSEMDGESYMETVMFAYIEAVPTRLARYLRQFHPRYYKSFSKTAKSHYWMNHCRCGAPLGDFFLHSEPGAPFFPTSEADCEEMTLTALKGSGFVALTASPSFSSGDGLLQYSKRGTPPAEHARKA